MKNLQRVLFLFSFALMFSVILQSCCDNRLYKIVGFESIRSTPDATAANGPFSLSMNLKLEAVGFENNFSLINSAYAVSCDLNLANPLDKSNITATVDKEFTFNGESIPANTDLISLSGVEVDYYEEFVHVQFGSNFVDKASFEFEDHTFTVRAITEDDITIESQISLFMRIN